MQSVAWEPLEPERNIVGIATIRDDPARALRRHLREHRISLEGQCDKLSKRDTTRNPRLRVFEIAKMRVRAFRGIAKDKYDVWHGIEL